MVSSVSGWDYSSAGWQTGKTVATRMSTSEGMPPKGAVSGNDRMPMPEATVSAQPCW